MKTTLKKNKYFNDLNNIVLEILNNNKIDLKEIKFSYFDLKEIVSDYDNEILFCIKIESENYNLIEKIDTNICKIIDFTDSFQYDYVITFEKIIRTNVDLILFFTLLK